MRADGLRAARALVLPTLALVVVLAFVPGEAGLAARAYALLLCVLAFLLALAALHRGLPRERPLRARAPKRRGRERLAIPETLERIEQETHLGIASSFDLHHRLRRRVRDLATELLSTRRRIALDDQPEAARDILGEVTWELVRPERPPPEDRFARGISTADLGKIVDSLEKI